MFDSLLEECRNPALFVFGDTSRGGVDLSSSFNQKII